MATQMVTFSAREEMATPVDFAYDRANRFGRFARAAREAGARVRRIEPDEAAGRNVRFEVEHLIRGSRRRFTLELKDRVKPEHVCFLIVSDLVEGELTIGFRPMGAARSRVDVAVALAGRTLKARIALKSLTMGRKSVEARLADQIARSARQAEQEWRDETGTS